MNEQGPMCVLHPDEKAITTAAQIPVCERCSYDYTKEGKTGATDRPFYDRLISAYQSNLAAPEVHNRMTFPHEIVEVAEQAEKLARTLLREDITAITVMCCDKKLVFESAPTQVVLGTYDVKITYYLDGVKK